MTATGGVARVERDSGLDVLRILAVVGVVAIHLSAALVVNDAIRGSGSWWAAVVVDIGNVWVVPVLVMVSGALVLQPRAHAAGPTSFYRRRLLRLGPAIVFWPLFYIVVVRIGLSGESIGPTKLLQLFLDGSPYTHLYFLWLIVGLYAVAPVIAGFLSGGGDRRAMILAGCVILATIAVTATAGLSALFGTPRPIVLTALTQWIPYVGYFVAGYALRRLRVPRAWLIVIAIATVGLLVDEIFRYANRGSAPFVDAVTPVSYLGVGVAAASIGVFVVVNGVLGGRALGVRTAGVIRRLSNASFGVYLIHFALIIAVRTFVPGATALLETSFVAMAVAWAGIVAVSFGLSIAAARVPFLRRVF